MSTVEDRRPTIGERYSAATESSNLRVEGDRRGDVDLLLASGYIGKIDPLGAALYRLAVEFDSARGELDATRKWASDQQAEARALRALACHLNAVAEVGPEADMGLQCYLTLDRARRAGQCEADAGILERTASASVRTELALALVRMKSLREARELLGELAYMEATRQRFMEPDHVVAVLAGRVLEHWLDPNCDKCDGRGFVGGSHRGELQALCRPCRGSGARRDLLGQTAEQQRFCAHLRAGMDRRLADVDDAMLNWLRAY